MWVEITGNSDGNHRKSPGITGPEMDYLDEAFRGVFQAAKRLADGGQPKGAADAATEEDGRWRMEDGQGLVNRRVAVCDKPRSFRHPSPARST